MTGGWQEADLGELIWNPWAKQVMRLRLMKQLHSSQGHLNVEILLQ